MARRKVLRFAQDDTLRIRIGTRGSQLALWQANETARLLTEAGYAPELVIVKTTGDKRHDVSLAACPAGALH